LTPKRVNKLLYIQLNRRTLKRDQKVGLLREEDEGFTTEEEQEEAFCHTAEAQDVSEDVEMGSEGELQK
jgi:hypothetical protein